MTPKRIKAILISVSLAVTLFFFVKSLVVVVMYFKNPLDFSFAKVLVCVGLMFLIFGHLGGYVWIMEDKQRVRRKVEDDPEWWTKWDRV